MKKIAVDTLPLVSGHAARGMGVYVRNLLKHLNKKVDSFLFLENMDKLHDYDVIHYPYFDLFYHTLPIAKQAKTVVTIPDVTPLLYPKYYPPGLKGSINFIFQKIALRNINAVITISETSKKDIVRFLNISADRVFVTKLASNFKIVKKPEQFISKVKLRYKLPDEFVLYIGDVNWNKNLLRLIKAVKKINRTLVIVCKSAVNIDYDKNHIENAPLREIQEKYGKDKEVMRLGFVPDEDLNAIWQLATVYCMPSLYEGFGLSVVEAMDAGVPLVCSRTQALVEVAGDAAEYFDPYSVDDIARKLAKVISDKQLQKELVLKGKSMAKDYSWQKTAKQTLEVYESLR